MDDWRVALSGISSEINTAARKRSLELFAPAALAGLARRARSVISARASNIARGIRRERGANVVHGVPAAVQIADA